MNDDNIQQGAHNREMEAYYTEANKILENMSFYPFSELYSDVSDDASLIWDEHCSEQRFTTNNVVIHYRILIPLY